VPPVEVRRLTAADLPALSSEVERARTGGDLRASSDPAALFFLEAARLDPSILGGAFADDGLVGWVSSEFKVVVVRPDSRRQGIGRRLVEEGLAIERDRGRPDLLVGRLPGDDVAGAFLAATGFSLHSILWDLGLDPDTPVAGPIWPDGHRARLLDDAHELAAWVDLFNVAFADHATPLQIDLAAARAGLDDPALEPADMLVVEDVATRELVGFCATTPERQDGLVGPHAEIWTIGVRPERQGRGLGRQLLRWGVERLRSIGVRDVALSVNGRNERALGLYEAEGFRRLATRERWARPVAVAPATAGR
jgi:mycothiol synthase